MHLQRPKCPMVKLQPKPKTPKAKPKLSNTKPQERLQGPVLAITTATVTPQTPTHTQTNSPNFPTPKDPNTNRIHQQTTNTYQRILERFVHSKNKTRQHIKLNLRQCNNNLRHAPSCFSSASRQLHLSFLIHLLGSGPTFVYLHRESLQSHFIRTANLVHGGFCCSEFSIQREHFCN